MQHNCAQCSVESATTAVTTCFAVHVIWNQNKLTLTMLFSRLHRMRERTFRKQRRRLLPETIPPSAFHAGDGVGWQLDDDGFSLIDGPLHRVPEFATDICASHLWTIQHKTNRTGQVRRARPSATQHNR
jgi:hypothetical protein